MAAPTVLSLYSGGGSLDLGFKLAIPSARTVCYVEREITAAALLVDHMQTGQLDDAPLWTDAGTFDGIPWRGTVDWIIGGPPCQPFSVAGKRLGADDPRNQWPDALRVVSEVAPGGCFFENVPSADSLWYIYEEVGPCLRALGYEVEIGIFSAAELGAPHRRERVFIVAHPTNDASVTQRVRELADTSPISRQVPPTGRPDGEIGGTTTRPGRELAHPRHSAGRTEHGQQHTLETARSGQSGNDVGIVQSERVEGDRTSGIEVVSTQTGAPLFGRGGRAFPPDRTDWSEWAAVITERPDLAPASEPGFRRMADGLARPMAGLPRADRLRILGLGVVPVTAALAFRLLLDRLDIPD